MTTKAWFRRSADRAAKDSVLTWEISFASERATRKRNEKSAEVVVVAHHRDEGPNGEESETSVSLEGARPQKTGKPVPTSESTGEAPRVRRGVEAQSATHENERSGTSELMEKVLKRLNLQQALKRVKKNKGSPGIDGMTVDELPDYLRAHWDELREQLLTGTYRPAPVKRKLIPKGSGGMRELGIPTVIDRFIQQALLQVLQPQFDPGFSQHSHGFRPGRRAHDAVREAQRYVQKGRRWVVDVDLEKFFDRMNHDVLMGRLAKRISDKRVLKLVRSYLDAGILANGVVMERHEGTPQGGPLSPLLANVLLDEVDKELEKRVSDFSCNGRGGEVHVTQGFGLRNGLRIACCSPSAARPGAPTGWPHAAGLRFDSQKYSRTLFWTLVTPASMSPPVHPRNS